MASNFQRRDDEIEPDVIIQRYSLRSDTAAVLVSPLPTPTGRCRNN
jgi:hypothetical protein